MVENNTTLKNNDYLAKKTGLAKGDGGSPGPVEADFITEIDVSEQVESKPAEDAAFALSFRDRILFSMLGQLVVFRKIAQTPAFAEDGNVVPLGRSVDLYGPSEIYGAPAKVEMLELTERLAAHLLEKHFKWVRTGQKKGALTKERAKVDRRVAHMMAGPEVMAPFVIPIDGFVTTPIIDTENALVTNRVGYDGPTRHFFGVQEFDPETEPFDSPEEALDWLINEWLGEFQFETDRDALLALAVPMTLLMARAHIFLPGQKWPFFTITAPAAGTGKTELAKVLIAAVMGQTEPDFLAWPEDTPGEMAKLLSSAALSDPVALVFDNLPNGAKINEPAFDRYITSRTMKFRVLGKIDTRIANCGATAVLTGNNLDYGNADARTRGIEIRMGSKSGDPANKTYSRDIADWTREHQPRILGALAQVLTAGWDEQPGEIIGRFARWRQAVARPLIGASGDQHLLDQWIGSGGASMPEDLWGLLFAMWEWQESDAAHDLGGPKIKRTTREIVADHPDQAIAICNFKDDKVADNFYLADPKPEPAKAGQPPKPAEPPKLTKAQRVNLETARKTVSRRLSEALANVRGQTVMGLRLQMGEQKDSKGRPGRVWWVEKIEMPEESASATPDVADFTAETATEPDPTKAP